MLVVCACVCVYGFLHLITTNDKGLGFGMDRRKHGTHRVCVPWVTDQS